MAPIPAPRNPPVYGADLWQRDPDGQEWSYWDRWLSLACVTRAGGDFEALTELLFAERRHEEIVEPIWAHLLDLRDRLAQASLTPAALVGDLVPPGYAVCPRRRPRYCATPSAAGTVPRP